MSKVKRGRYHRLADEAKRAIIIGALTDHAGNVSAAARSLGLARTYIYRLMRQFRIGRPNP